MKRSTKIWSIVAGLLILFGLIIFTGVMIMLDWDFTKLSTKKFETATYEITEDITDISVVGDTANVILVSSKGEASVECYEDKNEKHSVTVENGRLTIRPKSQKKWYQYISFGFSSPKITVTLPKGEYNDLNIKVSTGSIDVFEGFTFGDVTLSASTGRISLEGINASSAALSTNTGRVTASRVTCENDMKIKISTGKTALSSISCKNLITEGDTGSITLKSVVAAGRIDIERDTGDVIFEKCDGGEIYVKTDTGDVRGSLLTEKVFSAKTDTGKVSVPSSASGGACRIETDTGDIDITVG